LDLFHTTQEAQRVLAQKWRRAESLWEQAEDCDAGVKRAKVQGVDARGPALLVLLGPKRLRHQQIHCLQCPERSPKIMPTSANQE
jgi:hypothetical protein